MRFIVLEGPDGSGKTTLANALAKRGYRIVHQGPPKPGEDLFKSYLDVLAQTYNLDKHTVHDRLHLGERIYGPVMRGASLFTELQERVFERYTEAMDAQIVLCLPPWRIVLANWLANRPREYVDTVEKLKRIYNAYLKHLYSGRPYVWFDYTRHRVTPFGDSLMSLSGNALLAGTTGSQWPRFLFISETDPMHLTKDGMELNNRIMLAGYEERDIAFCSIKFSDIMNTLFLQFHNTPKVLALGKGAGVCHWHGIPHLPLESMPEIKELASIRRRTK